MSYSVEEITFKSTNKINTIYGNIYIPNEKKSIRGVFQISHGMCEYIEKYDEFAKYLVENGYIVCGHSHIGHGKSVVSKSELGYFAEENGYKYLINDLYELTKIVKRRFPKIPYFVYGHSMGSFLARCYVTKYGSELDGLLLSGTGSLNPLTEPALKFADMIVKSKGSKYRSRKLTDLAIGVFNDKFKPLKNSYEWVTSDIKMSEKFSKDEKSNFIFTVSGYKDLFTLQKYCNTTTWGEKVPNKLPIYIFCGDKDPVGDFGAGSTKVYNMLVNSGCKDVTFRLYPDKRHDLLNETNKDEVYSEILNWLNIKTNRKRDIIKKIEVVEQFIEGKTKNKFECEDDIFYNNDFVVVIDGISEEVPKDTKVIPGKFASVWIKSAFQNIEADDNIKEIIKKINKEFNKEENLYEEAKELRPSATIVIYSRYYNQVYIIGSARALIGNNYYGKDLASERVFAEVRAFINRTEFYKGKTIEELQKDDIGEKYIKDLMIKQQEVQNNHDEDKLHYVAIDGREISKKEILTIDVPMGVDYIVLASDGYLELKNSLEKTEQIQNEILKKDPLLIFKYRGVKGVKIGNNSFDDRAYIKFRITE